MRCLIEFKGQIREENFDEHLMLPRSKWLVGIFDEGFCYNCSKWTITRDGLFWSEKDGHRKITDFTNAFKVLELMQEFFADPSKFSGEICGLGCNGLKKLVKARGDGLMIVDESTNGSRDYRTTPIVIRKEDLEVEGFSEWFGLVKSMLDLDSINLIMHKNFDQMYACQPVGNISTINAEGAG